MTSFRTCHTSTSNDLFITVAHPSSVAGGSSVGLVYKLNQALSLPIVSLLQGLFLHSEGPVLHLFWDIGRERRGEDKKDRTTCDSQDEHKVL